MSFGGRLKELRESAGMTQQELAVKIGVIGQNVSRWERNESVPSWAYIQALADALGVSCEAFREQVAGQEEGEEGRESVEPIEEPTEDAVELEKPTEEKPAKKTRKGKG